MTDWISKKDWKTIVAKAPMVFVELLVRYDDGLLFGKRANEPAKGYWFFADGRVHKVETRREAVHRVADEELGLSVDIVELLGGFEHSYDTFDIEKIEIKHYFANGYVVDVIDG